MGEIRFQIREIRLNSGEDFLNPPQLSEFGVGFLRSPAAFRDGGQGDALCRLKGGSEPGIQFRSHFPECCFEALQCGPSQILHVAAHEISGLLPKLTSDRRAARLFRKKSPDNPARRWNQAVDALLGDPIRIVPKFEPFRRRRSFEGYFEQIGGGLSNSVDQAVDATPVSGDHSFDLSSKLLGYFAQPGSEELVDRGCDGSLDLALAAALLVARPPVVQRRQNMFPCRLPDSFRIHLQPLDSSPSFARKEIPHCLFLG